MKIYLKKFLKPSNTTTEESEFKIALKKEVSNKKITNLSIGVRFQTLFFNCKRTILTNKMNNVSSVSHVACLGSIFRYAENHPRKKIDINRKRTPIL